jgi:hypothetical protein
MGVLAAAEKAIQADFITAITAATSTASASASASAYTSASAS